MPGGQVNIIFLGSDQRPQEGGFRTDVILLASLNPQTGFVSLLSFPRDLYVLVPGWGYQRINAAFSFGGFNLLRSTLIYNFGLQVDHYMMVNFSAFKQIIDQLDGIDVQVGQTLTDHRDKMGDYTIQAGLVHMDGETALWYVRSRYTSSDFDRTRRQQEVLVAIAQRLLSLNAISNAGEIYQIYRQNVTTDLALSDISPLFPLAPQLSNFGQIPRYLIVPPYVVNWIVPNSGAMVLLPQLNQLLPFIRQAVGAAP